MGFQSSSVFAKIGLLLTVVGFVVCVVGIVAPFWLTNDVLKTTVGVFFACSQGDCKPGGSEPLPFQTAMVAMEVIGMLLATPFLVIVLLLIFCDAISGKEWVRVVTLLLGYSAGTIVCATQKDSLMNLLPAMYRRLVPNFDLSWAFALTIVGGLLHLAASVFFTLDILM